MEFGPFLYASVADSADEFALQNAQDCFEIMAAFEHLTVESNDGILSLFEPQFGMLFDAVKWVFGCSTKDRKHGVILEAGDTIISPFACRHHAAIEAEDKRELGTVKRDL